MKPKNAAVTPDLNSLIELVEEHVAACVRGSCSVQPVCGPYIAAAADWRWSAFRVSQRAWRASLAPLRRRQGVERLLRSGSVESGGQRLAAVQVRRGCLDRRRALRGEAQGGGKRGKARRRRVASRDVVVQRRDVFLLRDTLPTGVP